MAAEVALVVEDDRLTGETLAAILRHHGYDVQLVTSVRDGLAALNSNPDFLLLDLMLPDGDGAIVLAGIRSRKLRTKVALLTAVMDNDRLTTLEQLGALRTFKKPLNPDAVLQWMGGQSRDPDLR